MKGEDNANAYLLPSWDEPLEKPADEGDEEEAEGEEEEREGEEEKVRLIGQEGSWRWPSIKPGQKFYMAK